MRKTIYSVGVAITLVIIGASYVRFEGRRMREGRDAVLARVQVLSQDIRTNGHKDALETLKNLARDGSEDIFSRIQAVEAFSDAAKADNAALVADIVSFLIELTQGAPDELKSPICRVLGRIGPRAGSAVGTVVRLMKEGRGTGLEAACASSLGKIGDSSELVVKALTDLVSAPGVREFGKGDELMALAALGERAHAAAPAVEVALDHEDLSYRWKAVHALSRIDPHNKRLVDAATSLLAAEDQVPRYYALDALSRVPLKNLRTASVSTRLRAAACDPVLENANLARELLRKLEITTSRCDP
jgi:hypothetical protein